MPLNCQLQTANCQLKASAPWFLSLWQSYGDQVALATEAGPVSYSQLIERYRQLHEMFSNSGIKSGDVVALLGDYHEYGVAAFFALQTLGTIIVPVAASAEVEMLPRLQSSGANVICKTTHSTVAIDHVGHTDAYTSPLLEKVRAEKHAGLVLFSSGSTGEPKAMVHDLDNLLSTYAEKRSKPICIYGLLLYDHVGGLNTLFNTLAIGGTLVSASTRDPLQVGALISRYQVQVLPASPSFLNLLLLAEVWQTHDLSSLRIISYGTEPMPPALLIRLKTVFPKVRFIQTFGTSETGIAQTVGKSSDSLFFKIEDPSLEWRIEAGELWLRSRTQILGYLNATMERFTTDGWFKTGDLVESADGGYFRIIGRTTGFINVAGQKVQPMEVEAVLLEHPAVIDCHVTGETHTMMGQIVTATVVVRTAVVETELRQALRVHCRSHLDSFKVPVKFRFVSELAMGSRLKKERK